MTDNQLHYIAGIIDGEGYLGISKVKQRNKNIYAYAIHFSVANTNLELLNYLLKITNLGRIYPHKQYSTKHKQLYVWKLKLNEIKILLPLIKDILIVKREQTKIVLELIDSMSKFNFTRWNPLTDDERINREILYDELKEINKRGV